MPPKTKSGKPNPLRNRAPIRAPPPRQAEEAAAAAAAAKAKAIATQAAAARSTKIPCVNPECTDPNVIDGICNSCGAVADDSNIVSEITFGENSNGAAVVQGTWLGEHQGVSRTLGRGLRHTGGPVEKQVNQDGEEKIKQHGHQLSLPETTVSAGIQIYKLASMVNFTQGRRIEHVAAVCLYCACRKEKPCKVMLIDFADKLGVNVFKLGHIFKCLHQAVPLAADGVKPVIPEDLIYRFAMKLEFGVLTRKVAEDAVRMVRRMSKDWMNIGRRPSGVCGACLILAARMNNFRRTITEVVYVVKVTTHTIQKRLEEFKLTPTSALTVEDFLSNEFLESAHDPPSFYEKTEEFQKTKKRRKRRIQHDGFGREDEDASVSGSEAGDGLNRRQKTTSPHPEQPAEPLRRDADGFAIPPQPTPAQTREVPIDPQLTQTQDTPNSETQGTQALQTTLRTQNTQVAATAASPDSPSELADGTDLVSRVMADETGTSFRELVRRFGDEGLIPEDAEEDDEDDGTPSIGDDDENASASGQQNSALSRKRKRAAEKPKKSTKEVHVSPEWLEDEAGLETTISEIVNDPNTLEHAVAYAEAKKRAAAHMVWAEQQAPSKVVNMDKHIGEDEFKDDPEVQNCMLSPADAAMKEKIWMNAHKSWLRLQQLKEWQRRQAELGPPKAKRNRKKKPRIGEGQSEPAATPQEASEKAMERLRLSTKINYKAFNTCFDFTIGSGMGSAATSRMTSRAGSIFTDDEDMASESGTPAPDEIFKKAERKTNYVPRRLREHSTSVTPLRTLAPSPAPRASQSPAPSIGSADDYYPPSPETSRKRQRPSFVAESEAETAKKPDDGWKATVDEEEQFKALEAQEEDYDDDYGNGDLDVDAFDDEAFAGGEDEEYGDEEC